MSIKELEEIWAEFDMTNIKNKNIEETNTNDSENIGICKNCSCCLVISKVINRPPMLRISIIIPIK